MGDTVILSPTPLGDEQAELSAMVGQLIAQLGDANQESVVADGGASRIAADALNAALSAEQLIRELHERIAQLEKLALTDELTGLLNRRGFERDLACAVAAARRYGEEGVIAFIDLDGFKEINDSLGHAAGDAALREVAALLAANTRLTDSVGRLGGDEFAILLKRTNWQNGIRRAHELHRLIDPAVVHFVDGRSIEVRSSLGLQPYHAGIDGDAAVLLARADAEMYEQKRLRGTGNRRIA
jgi:diguanylate cyclase (GGDEF)-like protein